MIAFFLFLRGCLLVNSNLLKLLLFFSSCIVTYGYYNSFGSKSKNVFTGLIPPRRDFNARVDQP